MDNPKDEGRSIELMTQHPGWKLLDGWIQEQMSSDRLSGLQDWESYQRIQAEITAYRRIYGQIDEYIHKAE